MNASTAVAKALKAEGTEIAFCFPTSPLIEAAAEEGIRIITCRTERTVTHMADAYGRISNGRKIGVCFVQNGPGIENAFVGVAEAYADSTPMLMMPSGPRTTRVGLPAEFDALKNYSSVIKWGETINAPSRVEELMTRAFTQFRVGRPRPVMLEMPEDVAHQEVDEKTWNYKAVPSFKPAGNPSDVTEAIRMLLAAQNPVIYAGQGVLWAEATDELLEFAELTNVPVMTTLLGKSSFPENHRLSLGIAGGTVTAMVNTFMPRADLVFAIGNSLSRNLVSAPVPRGKTIVQVTFDETDLNADTRVSHAIIGDAKLVLRQLIDEAKAKLGEGGRPDTVTKEIASIKQEWLQSWMPKFTSDETPINPYRVVWEMAQAYDHKKTIVTHDSGSPRGQIGTFYEAHAPRGYIGWGNSHQLGSSLGMALGAKLAAPDKLCVAYMGDAAFGMCGLDFETAAREQIPILALVLNNSWMAGYRRVIPVATEKYKVGNISGQYMKIAEALGCYAEKIDQPNEVGPAIQRAIKVTEAGRPAVLEFMTRSEEASARAGDWAVR